MKTESELTVEQQFKLKVCAEESKSLSLKQCRALLVEAMAQNMIKDNIIKDLLKNDNTFYC